MVLILSMFHKKYFSNNAYIGSLLHSFITFFPFPLL